MTSFLKVTSFDPLIVEANAGADGRNGSPGVSVTSASVNSQNHLVLVLSDGTNVDAGDITSNQASAIAASLSSKYVSRTTAQVALDTDGVPYFDSNIAFANAVPVLADTDGVPYLGAH